MSTEHWRARARRAELGPGAVTRLAEVVRALPSGPVALVGSRSLDDAQRAMLAWWAESEFTAHLRTPPELDAPSLAALSKELEAVQPAVVVGCGGGTVMDAAKALTRPGTTGLVLLPKTLSGSEHTANTARWEDGRKRVSTVGMADAVVADPALLVADPDILAPGALHAVAHALATLRDCRTGAFPATIARAALTDLVSALAAEDVSERGRTRFLRGAWMAAVGFALTGPRIGVHHLLVHTCADRGDHARFSARLLCSALLRTRFYDDVLAAAGRSLPGLEDRLADVAARWLPKVSAAAPRSQSDDHLPAVFARDAQLLMEAVTRG